MEEEGSVSRICEASKEETMRQAGPVGGGEGEGEWEEEDEEWVLVEEVDQEAKEEVSLRRKRLPPFDRVAVGGGGALIVVKPR